ncbi:MAG: acyltransferase [Candidatus Dadabacteria bacterium]|nr:MAG: acyltransferase [Candidatus Dadabacteria bacterium]
MVLRWMGWKAAGAPPELDRYVLIAAPHTSNWDFILTKALAWYYDLDIRWMGKHTLFRFPYGWFMRAMGGIPITRHRRSNVVDASAALFAERDSLVLTVPAEGTRSPVEFWKSGFYHIAHKAGVPIVLGYLDYGTKTGGFGPVIEPSGDQKRDMELIRAFYADKVGRHPDKFLEPRLRGEQDDGDLAQLTSDAAPRSADLDASAVEVQQPE